MNRVLKLAKEDFNFRKFLIGKLASSLTVNGQHYPSISFHSGNYLVITPKDTFHLKQWVSVGTSSSLTTFEVVNIQSVSQGEKVTLEPISGKTGSISKKSSKLFPKPKFSKEEKREIESARQLGKDLGRQAFEKGVQRAPALDSFLRRAMNRSSLGDEFGHAFNMALMEGWTSGWDRANLSRSDY